eukprot:1171630-Rhodomonas_salina.2
MATKVTMTVHHSRGVPSDAVSTPVLPTPQRNTISRQLPLPTFLPTHSSTVVLVFSQAKRMGEREERGEGRAGLGTRELVEGESRPEALEDGGPEVEGEHADAHDRVHDPRDVVLRQHQPQVDRNHHRVHHRRAVNPVVLHPRGPEDAGRDEEDEHTVCEPVRHPDPQLLHVEPFSPLPRQVQLHTHTHSLSARRNATRITQESMRGDATREREKASELERARESRCAPGGTGGQWCP